MSLWIKLWTIKEEKGKQSSEPDFLWTNWKVAGAIQIDNDFSSEKVVSSLADE